MDERVLRAQSWVGWGDIFTRAALRATKAGFSPMALCVFVWKALAPAGARSPQVVEALAPDVGEFLPPATGAG